MEQILDKIIFPPLIMNVYWHDSKTVRESDGRDKMAGMSGYITKPLEHMWDLYEVI